MWLKKYNPTKARFESIYPSNMKNYLKWYKDSEWDTLLTAPMTINRSTFAFASGGNPFDDNNCHGDTRCVCDWNEDNWLMTIANVGSAATPAYLMSKSDFSLTFLGNLDIPNNTRCADVLRDDDGTIYVVLDILENYVPLYSGSSITDLTLVENLALCASSAGNRHSKLSKIDGTYYLIVDRRIGTATSANGDLSLFSSTDMENWSTVADPWISPGACGYGTDTDLDQSSKLMKCGDQWVVAFACCAEPAVVGEENYSHTITFASGTSLTDMAMYDISGSDYWHYLLYPCYGGSVGGRRQLTADWCENGSTALFCDLATSDYYLMFRGLITRGIDSKMYVIKME